ncbi:MAG: outer membrane protein assembly factor BamA [Rhodospirillales bacterium]
MLRSGLLGPALVAVALVFGALPAAAQSYGVGTIKQILVEGAQRIEPGTVRSYLLIQEGDSFDRGRIDRSLKSLFATGLFADVTLKREGDNLVISVVENPIINRIAFEGNRKLNDETLEAEVSLRPRVIYTRTKVQSDIKRILTLYRRNGLFAAVVEPKVIQLEQNRVDLVFEVSEGKATEIRSVRFIGNREYSDGRLREIIRTRESAWWRFLSTDDTYDPDRMTLDRELLRRFYLKEGFADFRVMSAVAELSPDQKDFFLTFTLDEGPRYAFGEIQLESYMKDLDATTLDGEIEVETGDWYDADEVEATIDRLTTNVNEQGIAFVDVRPIVDRDREKKVINVTFEVNEGARVFVERIDIKGNVRTVDKVIRREFRLVEGDAFNAAKLRRSRQRVQNLNFFQKVDVEQLPGSAPDKTIIAVDVEEKSTGSLNMGVGFSTTAGALLDIGVKENNLLGLGQQLGLSGQIAQKQTNIDLAFTEPYFLDREIAAGFDVFHSETDLQDSSSIDVEQTGGRLRAGYPITERLRQGWSWGYERKTISDVDSGASSLVQDARGTRDLSEIGHSLSYDRRDSAITPTEGYIIRLKNDLAGLLGDAQHIRNRLSGGYFVPLADQWVLSFRGEAGVITGIGKDVHLLDRFFIGGDDLRGFATAGVGPRDTSTADALGGEWKYTGTAEVTFPLGLPNEFGIKGRLFTDMGSAGSLTPTNSTTEDSGTPRLSVGGGVTWTSPMGPIGVDIGVPLVKESYDETEIFRVNFGTRF